MDVINAVLRGISHAVLDTLPWLIGLMVLFTALGLYAERCNPSSRPWYRKPDLLADLVYWFVGPLLGTLFLTSFLAAAGLLMSSASPELARDYVAKGYGPLAGLGFWPQVVVYLLGSDLILYTTHRLYHGAALWRYHAIHHAPEHLDWTSAPRFHPINIAANAPFANAVLLLAGISPDVIVTLAPFNLFMGALVHSNLNWTFGPLRTVIASPVFHRWHHTAADRGGSSNFAPTFPFIDRLFGTYYMPLDALPDAYGVDDPHFPGSLAGQMLYPWRKHRGQPAESAAAGMPAGRQTGQVADPS